MSNVLKVAAVSAGVAAAETDPNFNQTVLLLHGDGTNGAQNNTFLDGSTNNFTITRNGNTTQGTFSPFSVGAGEFSNFFDGTGDYFSIARNAAFLPAVNTDFTVEAWVYLTATPGATNAKIIGLGEYGTDSDWILFINSSNQLVFYINSVPASYITTLTVPLNAWTHVAASRSGTSSNNLKVFINGVGALFSVNNTLVGNGNRALTIGADQNGDESLFTGYISNLRFINGTGIYTSNFTPSTTPLTAITNTSLLTCQSNRFVDNSTNAFAITRNGDVRVTPFSPFAPSAAYSASTNGGSGFFDGTGDYLSGSSNTAFALPGAFTFECWFYPNSFDQVTAIGDTIFSSIASGSITIGRTNTPTGNLWGLAETAIAWRLTSSTLPTNNTWNHIVVVRNSSNNISLFLNGTRLATTTLATSFTQNGFSIGSDNNTANSFLDGYLANVRLVKGTAVYDPTSTTLTVPTTPLTAITNTSLLCNFTNAGIFDNTGKNNLETVGNAQIDTGTKKFGTGSMEFDGSGDYLFASSRPELSGFNSGDWTIEAWIYPTTSKNQAIVNLFNTAGSNSGLGFTLSSTDALKVDNGLVAGINAGSVSLNTWTHVAAVRNGTTITAYINGSSVGTTLTTPNATQFAYIGRAADTLTQQFFQGYIDDLRITKGVARYTANFTAPTKEFPDQ